jgi:hypothetical protein
MSSAEWKKINKGMVNALRGTNVPQVLFLLFYVHLLFIVFQLHSFPGISILGAIRLPGFISFILCFVFFPFVVRVWKYLLVKLFVVLLTMEAVRGVLGYTVFPALVVNDMWQFQIWKLLLIYFLTLVIPLITIFANGKGLRFLFITFVVMGALLGTWSLTHKGFGPGGYLHDENDHCLLLVSLLPYPFFLITIYRSFFVKLLCVASSFLLLLGIIVSRSRGGYLGLFAVLIVFFIISRRKALWIGTAMAIGIISLPFIPDDFWGEVKSIKVESQKGTGTIQDRIDTWKIITRMWMDPGNILLGVGLENSRYNLGDYEDSAAGLYVKSRKGRATHSFYFQVLGDMGLYGMLLFGALIFHSLYLLRRVFKESMNLEALLQNNIYSPENKGTASRKDDRISDHSYRLLRRLHKEIVFLRNLSPVVFSSWFGMLVAAVGISVAYYPPFWLYCALSLSIHIYFERIRTLVRQTEKLMNAPQV